MSTHMLPDSGIKFLTIASDTTDYNVFTSAGAPAARVDVVLTINSGVVVYQTSANGGLIGNSAGGFFTGSTLKIINNGTICGKGGLGGDGGAPINNNGTNGGTGFTALYVNGSGLALVTIDNTNGSIFGGGGGGGGGGGAPVGGGGGGGGRGRLGGAHGVHGGASGSNGTDGSYSAPGSGGSGGGNGGDGGDWGQSGHAGFDASGLGGSGGPPGNAIYAGAVPITFIGGNNSTQVKGAIV